MAAAGPSLVGEVAGSEAARAGRVASPRFVGRAAELAALRVAVDQAVDGRPCTALLESPAGGGKSRLAAETAAVAAERGAVVVLGSCVDLGGSPLPYAAIADVFRGLQRQFGVDALLERVGPWAPDLAALLPALGSPPSATVATPGAGHARVLGGTRDLLESCSELAPLVLVIEDLHWADAATRDVVVYLARTLRDARILTIVTVRTEGVPAGGTLRGVLTELRRLPGLLDLPLPALTPAYVRDQVAAILGRTPEEELLTSIVERAGGNPFFVEELLASATAGTHLSPALEDVLLRRIGRLSAASLSVAAAAAIVGRRVDERLLNVITELDDDAFDAAVREALDEGVVVRDPGSGGYAIRHALLQEVLQGQLLPAERRRLHARAASVLTPSPSTRGSARARGLGEAAHHLHRSGADDVALQAFVAAAQAAEHVFAHADASSYYDRALELWDAGADPPVGVSLVDVLERSAEALWFGVGDAAGASERLREALDLVDPDDLVRRAELSSRLAGFAWETDAAAGEALALHAEARRLVGDEDGPVRTRVLRRQARALMIASHIDDAEAVAREALEAAARVGGIVDEADARITLFACRITRGDVPGARSEIERTRALVRAIDDPDTVARFFNNAAMYAYWIGRYDEAVRTADEGDARLQRLGMSADDRMNIATVAAASLSLLGRLDEAEQRLSVADPQLPIAAVNVAVQRANIARMRGDLDTARQHLDRAAALGAAVKDPPVDVQLAALRTDVGAWDEDPVAAWRDAEAGLAILAHDVPAISAAWMLTVALRVVAETGVGAVRPPSLAGLSAEETADALLARLEAVADATGGPLPVVDAYVVQGRGERSRLSEPGDATTWQRAVASWEALGRTFDAAYARLRHAEALFARGEASADLQPILAAARGQAERVGATKLLAAIAQLETRVPTVATSYRSNLSPDQPTGDMAASVSPTVTLQREGEYWTVSQTAGAVQLRDSKGLRYLAQLLANPGVEVHAAELVSGLGPATVVARAEGLALDQGGALGPALDARAKAEYRRRVDDLREELEEADSFNDPERAVRAREEYDFLLVELSRAVGLGGRDRPVGSSAERARVSATKAIRAAIRRIGEQDVALGESLGATVRTGTFCSYQPLAETPRWRVVV